MGGIYIHTMEKYSSLRTYVLFNKTTKLMNHLGGMGLAWWFVLSGSQGHDLACVSHLWMATQEQRDLRCQMLRSFKCNHMALWALAGSYRSQ